MCRFKNENKMSKFCQVCQVLVKNTLVGAYSIRSDVFICGKLYSHLRAD